MKHIAVILLLVFTIFFTGCLRNNNKSRSQDSAVEKDRFVEEDLSDEEWDIEDYKRAIVSRNKNLEIEEFEEFATFETGENYFLCKWKSFPGSVCSIFSFNKQKEFQYLPIGFDMDEKIIDIIARGIPGIRLWDAPIFIGDFNNDGANEIASQIYTASAPNFIIVGIDPDSKDVVYHFDRSNGFGIDLTFPVVEFIKYKDMDGFKMLRLVPPPERPSVKYPYDRYNTLAWFFYTWDENERKYLMVEEVDPDYLEETNTEVVTKEEAENE